VDKEIILFLRHSREVLPNSPLKIRGVRGVVRERIQF
jgi:hypothetical protein